MFKENMFPNPRQIKSDFCWIANSRTEFEKIRSVLVQSGNFQIVEPDLRSAAKISLRREETLKRVYGDDYQFNSGLSEAIRSLVFAILSAERERSSKLQEKQKGSLEVQIYEARKAAWRLQDFLACQGWLELHPKELVEIAVGTMLSEQESLDTLQIYSKRLSGITWKDLDENLKAVLHAHAFFWEVQLSENLDQVSLPFLMPLPKAIRLNDVDDCFKFEALCSWVRGLKKHQGSALIQVDDTGAKEVLEKFLSEQGLQIEHCPGSQINR